MSVITIDQVNWVHWIKLIHFQWAVPMGWWTDLDTNERKDRDFDELCMLIVTELAEAMEGVRKNLMDDKILTREMVEVEMADAAIRLLDMAGGFNFGILTTPSHQPLTDFVTQGGYLLKITQQVCILSSCHEDRRAFVAGKILQMIIDYCREYGYDLFAAMEEKHEFNKTRADHTLEARRAEGGKKA